MGPFDDGRCGLVCDAGFADCNGVASDGCEVAVGGACSPSACASSVIAREGGDGRCVTTAITAAGSTCRPVAGDDCAHVAIASCAP